MLTTLKAEQGDAAREESGDQRHGAFSRVPCNGEVLEQTTAAGGSRSGFDIQRRDRTHQSIIPLSAPDEKDRSVLPDERVSGARDEAREVQPVPGV
jgi:hypothetical protein